MNAQKKAKSLEWSDEMEEKFRQLKQKFSEIPFRGYPEYEGDMFELTTDYSSQNLGAILSQMQGGKSRMIGCAGRKTTVYERNYASMKGKLAAVIFELRKFEHILCFKQFKVRTDNSTLTYLHSKKQPRGILA